MDEVAPSRRKAMRLIMASHSFCRVGVDRECDVRALQWADGMEFWSEGINMM